MTEIRRPISEKTILSVIILQHKIQCFRLFACLVFLFCNASVFAKDEMPPWLKQASATGATSYGKNVPAVVLFDEATFRIEEDGRITKTFRYAVKILKAEGKREARGAAGYESDKQKVKDMRGWLIRPTEEVKRYGKDEILDVASVDNDIYNEARVKIISATNTAEPGAIFGYEYTIEERLTFTQFRWDFQDDLPVVVSRFIITMPTGWRAESVTFNHSKIEPTVNGSTYTWEIRDLAMIEDEPASPPVTSLAPRLAVTYFPPANKENFGKAFSTWEDIARWYYDLSDSQAIINDPLAAKARDLTANAKTELEKIQVIGRFVQQINYVSIQIGMGRYRPHSSIEVFTKSYGDCKDKANLMRAMLKAIGIDSYLVLIYSGDPTYVREEWPSSQQFNHCIIAIKVGDSTSTATVMKHPALGRLLIFDPTNENTPVGDLPDFEQNSFALIAASEGGSLVRMPVTPPEMNRLERQIEATLNVDGLLSAKIMERAVGQKAVDFRREFRNLAHPDYVKRIERWITSGATGASISKIEPADNHAEGKFALYVEFSAPRYAQSLQGRLLVFKPAIVSRRDSLFLTDENRQNPVVLDAQAYTEVVKVKLPDGFEVDEMPNPVKLDAPFGSYKVSYEVKDGFLNFSRSMIISGAMIPASDYEKVKRFYATMRAAEQAPVVLTKK
jgi:Domain of Unknown Function with PDB structure (DUF3857)/Transglutaminase-like superfamily